jgi:hypothetical protein
MPLPTPILDDRTWQQLRDELVRRIPVYTPEWTDHNASDPGITLLELFAFLGENLLFRFNQIPEATRLAFLKLLSFPLRPACAARALVSVSTSEPAGVPVPLGTEALAGAVPFETTVELCAWPVSALAVCRTPAPEPDPESDAGVYAGAAKDAAQLTGDEAPAYYVNEQVPLDPLEAGTTPIDFSAAVDRMLWIAVLAEDGADRSKLAGGFLNVGVVPDETVEDLDDGLLPCPGVGSAAGRPDLVWEVSTGSFNDTTGAPVYRGLTVRGDTTAGLTREGVVRLELPRDTLQLRPFALTDPDLGGTRSLPPMLEDEALEAKVLFWLRAFRPDTSSLLPRIRWVGVNVTSVVQHRKAGPFFLGTGNGQARQSFQLPNTPVVERTLKLEVEEGARFVEWTEVDGFEASGGDDRHFLVDREAGTVAFGNGLRGRAPQIGERIRAREWRYGGGEEGNVTPGAINKLPEVSGVEVKNLLPATGGAPDESISEALERLPGELRRRDRAVTASDFHELALATPGAAVGRAETLARFHPPTRKPDEPGVVSVVVWPREDPRHPNAPMPDRLLLRRVCEYLDTRRLVTTELWVIPPTYRRISVGVGVEAKEGFGIEAVRRWVELALRQYLSPLPPYGPEGGGWPLGRPVDARELEAAALQVEGVAFLSDELRIAEWSEAGQAWVEPERRTVMLSSWEVPELAEITVARGAAPRPGEALGPPPLPTVPVPIPTLRDEC